MPKLNVNDATREQLVETAGLRPAVADALLEYRAKHGGKITSPEALGELSGVGPATLDQLREVLDFRDKGGNGHDKPGREAEREVRQTTEKAAEATTAVARSGAKVAREVTETGAQATTAATRSGLQLVERTAGAFGEVQRETAQRSAEATAELGRLFVELLSEQTRHNMEVATAFSRSANWGEIARLQGEFVRASFERVNRLNGRYLEVVQDVMRATVSAARQSRRAA
jgi:Helix-hairpin-helix motif